MLARPLARLVGVFLAVGLCSSAPGGAAWAADEAAAARRQDLVAAAAASLPAEEAPDRTLAPYFFVHGGEPGREVFPLKSSQAHVRVLDSIAEVQLTQVYRNEGKDTLEAIYLFPLSTRAAVHALSMHIGPRVIEAQLRERGQARARYEEARTSGRSASLLEQLRPNVAQMSLGNLRPGDEVRVELAYTERLLPEERVYELVLPSVVGPRYSNTKASQAKASERWVQSPYVGSGAGPVQRSSIEVTLESGLAISQLRSASHQASISFESAHRARVLVSERDHAGDRDFILRYQLAGQAIDAGAVLERDGAGQLFAVTIEPPARVEPQELLPREYVFIVDTSGSMNGFPLDIARQLLGHVLDELRPSDQINILTFAGTSDVLAPASLPATPQNLARARRFLERQHAGGGTELLPALTRALALERSAGCSRSVVVITDGYVSIESETFDLVRRSLGRANLFTFGIGSSVNRHLIEGLARAGDGEAFVVSNAKEAPRQAARFVEYVRAPVLTDVSLRYEGLQVTDVEPRAIPDLFASRPIVITGRLGATHEGRVVLSGRTAKGPYSRTIELASLPSAPGELLARLWARQRIARLSDDASPSERERNRLAVIALGLRYHLLTEHTAFVAVDSEVRGRPGQRQAVQPLQMPDAVDSRGVLEGVMGTSSGSIFGSGAGYGSAYGMGGLGVVGTGGGGGGGTIGIGSLGGIGRGGSRGGSRSTGAITRLAPLRVEPVIVRGGLDRAVIARIIRRHAGELRFCYERALGVAAAGVPLSGHVILSFTIDAAGAVVASSTSESTLGNAKLEAELAEVARHWQFPAQPGGGQTIVRYPLDFGR